MSRLFPRFLSMTSFLFQRRLLRFHYHHLRRGIVVTLRNVLLLLLFLREFLEGERDFPHLESLVAAAATPQTSFVPALALQLSRWRRWHGVRIRSTRLLLRPRGRYHLSRAQFFNLQEIFLRVRADLNDRFRFHVFFNLLPVSLVSVSSRKEDE